MPEEAQPTSNLSLESIGGDSSTGDMAESQVGTPKVGGVSPTVNIPPKSPWILILSLLLVAAIAAASYFYFQYSKLSLTASLAVSPTPIASSSPTTDMKSYNNNVFNFSFEYPTEYLLNDNLQTSIDPMAWTTRNTLTLENPANQCSIAMMINPDGFGPNFPNYTIQGKYVEGEGFVVNSKTPNTENLTPDIYNLIFSGEVKVGKVTSFWSSITCPDTVANQSAAEKIFTQILATFKFAYLSSKDLESVLDIIARITTPMIWSKPIVGTLSDLQGNDVNGLLISSKAGSKSENKLAQFLASDTPLIKEYGWSNMQFADGLGEQIVTFDKGTQKLVVRYSGGEYKVLLSN